MRILRWIVVATIFIVLLLISLQNAQPVTLQVLNVYSWQAPLVFVVLIAFAVGVTLGLLAGAINIVRLKRQLGRLRREQRAGATSPPTHGPAPGTGPATGPGFEPPTGFQRPR